MERGNQGGNAENQGRNVGNQVGNAGNQGGNGAGNVGNVGNAGNFIIIIHLFQFGFTNGT